MAAAHTSAHAESSALPLQVRNGQLDKEAGELRDENAQLHRECERLRGDAASGARVCLLGPQSVHERLHRHTS
jgi:hypothetical protein